MQRRSPPHRQARRRPTWARLMSGDAAKINSLWLEKTGQEMPEDLSDVWPVQLGTVTEQLNLDWYERRQRQAISRRGDVVEHYAYDWACCTLDGWIDDMQCPIECKHVGGREPWEVIEERYQPQLQWQMEVTGANQCALSVIMGVSEPIVEFIKRDIAYATQLTRSRQAVYRARPQQDAAGRSARRARADRRQGDLRYGWLK